MPGDAIGAGVDDARNVVIGQGNQQWVTETSAAGDAAVGSHQNVTHVNVSDRESARFNGEMEILHIRQQVDRTGDRLEDVAMRVQQIEIALQIGTPNKTSQGERIIMLVVIAASLLMFLFNAYIQVAVR